MPNGPIPAGATTRFCPVNRKLSKDETDLVGGLVEKQGSIVPDSVTDGIHFLTKHVLKQVGSFDYGWDVLYVDQNDGRFWELSYPESGSHGGGAPRLTTISPQQARVKYKI